MSVFCVSEILSNIQSIIGSLKSRYCGQPVCSQCSNNLVKKIWTCDLCIFHLKNPTHESTLTDYTKMIQDQNLHLENNINDYEYKS